MAQCKHHLLREAFRCAQQLAVSFPGPSVSLSGVMALLSPLDCESCFVSPELSLVSGKQQGLNNKCFPALYPPSTVAGMWGLSQQTTVTGAESDCLSAWDPVSAGRHQSPGSGLALP